MPDPSNYRPYPPPPGPWMMNQTWNDLLFAHWPLPADLIAPLLPAGLALDRFGGEAWLGIVPFRMSNVGPRLVPPLPWLSAFPELNVRTYVTVRGEPGVFFFSLDAANPVAVRAARLGFRLPYYEAQMAARVVGGQVHYSSIRTHRHAPAAAFIGSYGPTGPVSVPSPGSLEYALTARYCLYTVDRGGAVFRAEIDHAPWPLQAAQAEFEVNTMIEPYGLNLPDTPPLLHFARRLDVHVWLPQRLI